MSLLFTLILIWLSAKIFGYGANKLSIPPVLGELVAGVLLGPSLLNWVKPNHLLQFFAEIGIVLLLFEVGLDTDLKRLHASGKKALTVACLGVILPLILGYGASHYLFKLSALEALFIGGTLTATSIGITVRVLSDLKQRHSHEAHIVIGAAILDDILGVLLLAVLYEFARAGVIKVSSLGLISLQILIFMLCVPLLSKAVLGLVSLLRVRHAPFLVLILSLVLLLGFSYLANLWGVPEIMAGFAVGLAASSQFGLKFSGIGSINGIIRYFQVQ